MICEGCRTYITYTGKERDGETGLDYFGARYMSAAQGRFTSPDDPLVDQDPADPQSWNLYGYVRNNPLRFIDPTGRTCRHAGKLMYDDNDGQGCSKVDAADKELKPSMTVTVSNQELALMTLRSVGDTLSSPRAWASVALGGMEGAQQVMSMRGILNWRWWIGQGIANAARKNGKDYREFGGRFPGFPDLRKVRAKTPYQGGGSLRPRWKDSEGNIYEWDAQHKAFEKYDPSGRRHFGQFDPETGVMQKGPEPGRAVEP